MYDASAGGGSIRSPSQKLSNTPGRDDRQQIRITHPFHPLRGKSFRFVVSKQLWGEDRVTLQLPDGSLRSLPESWTDLMPPDPYLVFGGGRCRFRVEDLVALAHLISEKRQQ